MKRMAVAAPFAAIALLLAWAWPRGDTLPPAGPVAAVPLATALAAWPTAAADAPAAAAEAPAAAPAAPVSVANAPREECNEQREPPPAAIASAVPPPAAAPQHTDLPDGEPGAETEALND